jgi:uncharacterized protein (TIGR04141 family)
MRRTNPEPLPDHSRKYALIAVINMPRPRGLSPTRRQTLYLLTDIEPTLEGLRTALDDDGIREQGYQLATPTSLPVPALLAYGSAPSDADWCADARITTGLPISFTDHRSGAVLLVAVDDQVYGITYGAGRWLLRDECKDQRFGLRYAVRQLDPRHINRLVQRFPASRGRQDSVLVPGGLPIWCYGLEAYAGIVGHIGGELKTTDLTTGTRGRRGVRIDGAAGLNLRLGVKPGALIGDIRAIAAICRNRAPDPALEPIENIVPISSGALADDLDADLEELLGWPESQAAEYLSPVVPTAMLDTFLASQSLVIRIGSTPIHAGNLDLDDILRRTRSQRDGRRLAALRSGHVHLFADPGADEPLGSSRAINWLEATLTRGSRQLFLADGTWYEIGAAYIGSIRRQVQDLISAVPSLDLPAWDPAHDERRYNQHVQDVRAGYVNLDRNLVRAGLHEDTGFEPCDLLGPDNELIHVKRARGSAPLSHLFSQALVSMQTLANNAEARADFIAKVCDHAKGRTLPADFQPKKVTLAILLKDGERLSCDTLFPFSQVTLAHTARELQTRHQVTVEVIGISADSQ